MSLVKTASRVDAVGSWLTSTTAPAEASAADNRHGAVTPSKDSRALIGFFDGLAVKVGYPEVERNCYVLLVQNGGIMQNKPHAEAATVAKTAVK